MGQQPMSTDSWLTPGMIERAARAEYRTDMDTDTNTNTAHTIWWEETLSFVRRAYVERATAGLTAALESHPFLVVPVWRGHLGDFMFGGRQVGVDADPDGIFLTIYGTNFDTRLAMSFEQAERLGQELIAAARAKGVADA